MSVVQAVPVALADALGRRRIPGLDALRAIAISLVLFQHLAEGLGPVSGAAWLGVAEMVGGNGGGVELFFVLSGFLITWLLMQEWEAHGRLDLMGFYRRRVSRLMPLFYLYLVIGLLLLWWRQRPIPWGAVVSSVFYVVNYYQAFTGAASHFLSHCWSLAVEEQFYFIWPLALWWLLRRGPGRRGVASALCLLVGAVWLWRWALLAGSDLGPDYLYRALDTRADHLALGALAAVLCRRPRWQARCERWAQHRWLLPALVAACLVSAQLDNQWHAFKYGVGYMLEPLAMAVAIPLVVLSAGRARGLARWMGWAPVVRLGEVSYAAYLFHGMLGYTAAHAVFVHTGSALAALLAGFAVVVGVSNLLFVGFERPVRAWLNRWRPAGRRQPATA